MEATDWSERDTGHGSPQNLGQRRCRACFCQAEVCCLCRALIGAAPTCLVSPIGLSRQRGCCSLFGVHRFHLSPHVHRDSRFYDTRHTLRQRPPPSYNTFARAAIKLHRGSIQQVILYWFLPVHFKSHQWVSAFTPALTHLDFVRRVRANPQLALADSSSAQLLIAP